jgi:hypothetical protein
LKTKHINAVEENVVVNSENNTETINTALGRNADFLILKLVLHVAEYSEQWINI